MNVKNIINEDSPPFKYTFPLLCLIWLLNFNAFPLNGLWFCCETTSSSNWCDMHKRVTRTITFM